MLLIRRHFSLWYWGLFALAAFFAGEAAAQSYSFSTFAGQPSPSSLRALSPAGEGPFTNPLALAVDATGNVTVADPLGLGLARINPAGVITPLTTNALIPTGVALDGAGNLYIYDEEPRRLLLRKAFLGTGNSATFTDVAVLTERSPTSSQTPFDFGRGLGEPALRRGGLTLDAVGNIYVVDGTDATVRRVSPSGTVTTLAGMSNLSGYTDGLGPAARFQWPGGVTMDAAGNLYVAERSNHTIRLITPAGAVSTFAGQGETMGAVDGDATTARFMSPRDVALDRAGNLYVADTGNHTIRKITPAGTVSTLAGLAGAGGNDDGTGSAARFYGPEDVDVDAEGNIYVADTGNRRIRKITPTGVVTTLAGNAPIASPDGTGSAARFFTPGGVAADAAENIYIADTFSHTVRKITPAGVVTTLAGQTGVPGYLDGTGRIARFFRPSGIAVDATGTLYLADGDTAIRRITPAGVVTTVTRDVYLPSGLTVDRTGNLIFADLLLSSNGAPSRHRIRRLSPNGALTTVADQGIGVPGSYRRLSLAVDAAGTIYTADDSGDTIQKISSTGQISVLAGYPGQTGTTDDTGAAARFNGPSGLAFDAAGNLFVTDNDSTIRRITPGGEVTTVAGQPGDAGATEGVGGFARFRGPTDLAFDPAGNLYVVDTGNNIIRKGTPTSAVSPPTISTPSGSLAQNVALHGNATFAVAASGSALQYQWTKNGEPLPGATAATLTLPRVTTADAGAYVVRVSNSAGATTLEAGALAVFDTTLTSFTRRNERPGGSHLWSIASGHGLLVTVGDNGTILTSTDGRTWTRRTSGTSDWLVGVTFGAGKFIAVGDRGRILLSSDGVTWADATATATTQRLNNVIYAAGLFVAVGEGGAIVTSPDGQTWTPRESRVSGWLRGLAFNPAVETRTYTSYFVFPGTPTFRDADIASFAATGQDGVVLTSTDGVTWKREYTATSNDLEAIVAVPGRSNFVGIGQNGTAVDAPRTGFHQSRISFAGYSYSYGFANHPTGAAVRLRGLAQGASALFATGEDGVILAAPDINGPWARLPSDTTANLVAGVFHGNTLFVVGSEETIVQSDPIHTSRLINISTRGQVGTGANVMISGFVVSGSAPKQILLRAAGPALGAFGVTNALPTPLLSLFDGEARPMTTNMRWGGASNAPEIAATATRVGAFPFAPGSADSALLVTLPPGPYTAQVSGQDSATGVSLVEVYDADAPSDQGSRTVNISTRGQVGVGDNKLIAGFVLNGAASRRVLIRAVGPSLASFGLGGFLAEPQLQLYDQHGALQLTAAAWSERPDAEDIRSAGALVGAFSLQPESKDAAVVVSLLPGNYTVQVGGLNDTTGLALVEVYDLP